MSMVSRWSIRITVPLATDDCDDAGHLTDAGAQRVFAVARSAYFARCSTFDPRTVTVLNSAIRRGDAVAGDAVSIAVNVSEVFPDSWRMIARIRPVAGGDTAADARCTLSTGADVTTAMRDEFIALAHGASHMH
jgi:acyl-CoA thioesterase FadM